MFGGIDEALYNRVFKLEEGARINIYEVGERWDGEKIRFRHAVPIETAIRLILNHLGLELKSVPAGEEFQLVKKGE